MQVNHISKFLFIHKQELLDNGIALLSSGYGINVIINQLLLAPSSIFVLQENESIIDFNIIKSIFEEINKVGNIFASHALKGDVQHMNDYQMIITNETCQDQPKHIDDTSPVFSISMMIHENEENVDNTAFYKTAEQYNFVKEIHLPDPKFDQDYVLPWSSHQRLSSLMVPNGSMNVYHTRVIHNGVKPTQPGLRTFLVQSYTHASIYVAANNKTQNYNKDINDVSSDVTVKEFEYVNIRFPDNHALIASLLQETNGEWEFLVTEKYAKAHYRKILNKVQRASRNQSDSSSSTQNQTSSTTTKKTSSPSSTSNTYKKRRRSSRLDKTGKEEEEEEEAEEEDEKDEENKDEELEEQAPLLKRSKPTKNNSMVLEEQVHALS